MYSAVISASKNELSKKERIQLKDMTDVIRLDSATKDGDVIIEKVSNIVEIEIHNDKATPTDYKNIIVIAEDGTRYATGSTSFRNALFDIDNEMEGEEYGIRVYRRPSQNYAGRDFISCSVL